MNLPEIILDEIKRFHRGKENAIKREALLRFCRVFEPDLTDREMRDMYSQLPVCVCNKGIFWPIRPIEIKEFEIYMRKKALPHFNRAKMVIKYHKKLLSPKFIQWELFDGKQA